MTPASSDGPASGDGSANNDEPGPASAGAAAVEAAFRDVGAQGRAALVCYLPAGYPDLETSEACMRAVADAGADLLEVGFPFSDPVMDGPTIAAAAQTALESGTTVDDDLGLCRRLTADIGIPAVVMTYYTIPSVRGLGRFADEITDAGVAGAILPDLPVSEADEWIAESRRTGLATVFLASATSSDERLDAIAGAATGFVYATSVLGVTGVRDTVADARDLVSRVRARTDLPVGVGIGVSDAGQAAEVAGYADGVIVGSALVRAVGDGDRTGAADRVARLVTDLRAGVERADRDVIGT